MYSFVISSAAPSGSTRENRSIIASRHERENATAEVRRSFQGGYPPLYQAGYLVGAKQFWALRQELVTTGKMTERAFHDAILKENHMPVELVRAAIQGEKLSRDFKPEWKFLGDIPEAQFPKR